MIFSIGFTVITFNNSSQNSNSASNVNSNVPEALYSKCGESVCFVGSQLIISFGSFKYPVQYDIFKIGTQSDKIASPFVSDTPAMGNVSVVNFNSYHTKEIQNGKCTSADLIRSGNHTKAVDAFFFDSYGMSSSVAFQNMINASAVYIVDFTVVLPNSNNFKISGNDGNSVHSLNQNDFILDQNDSSIKIGGLNINWICDSKIFHMGEIKKMNGYDALILSFGPVKLSAHETYTIDPNMEPTISQGRPIHRSGGGGSGGGGGSTSTTTYPPTLSNLDISQPSSTCFANGSSDGHVKISYTVTSDTSNGPVREGYFEVTRNGNDILLGTSNAYQCENKCFSTTVNNIGCFSGFEIAYQYPGTSEWTCQDHLGHSFNEYVNFNTGYELPDLQEFPGQGKVIDASTGKVIAGISGGIILRSDSSRVYLYQSMISPKNVMGVNKRCYSFEYSGNSKGVSQSVYFHNLQASCVSTTCDYTPLEYFVAAVAVVLITAALSVMTDGASTIALIFEGGAITLHIAIALGKYFANPDHPVILNNVNHDQKLTCCQNAFDKAPNVPDPYFYYGCYQPSNMFSERFNLSVGYNDPSTMDHFTYGENFVLINTTLTGNVCEERETYSCSLTSPAYLLFG